MITWVLRLLGIVAIKLWEVVWDSIKKEVTAAINDKRLQSMAVRIVESLRDSDLTNEQKRETARGLLVVQARAIGMDIADSVANTVIELAVLYMKNKVSS